jgi:hypothetical protein
MIQSELCRTRWREALPVFVVARLVWKRTKRFPAGAGHLPDRPYPGRAPRRGPGGAGRGPLTVYRLRRGRAVQRPERTEVG